MFSLQFRLCELHALSAGTLRTAGVLSSGLREETTIRAITTMLTMPVTIMKILSLRYLQRVNKGCEFQSGGGGGGGGAERMFFSRVRFLFCPEIFGVRSTPVLPQLHVKDPGHSSQSVAGRLQLNTFAPLTQR